jgi:hypothetical protein
LLHHRAAHHLSSRIQDELILDVFLVPSSSVLGRADVKLNLVYDLMVENLKMVDKLADPLVFEKQQSITSRVGLFLLEATHSASSQTSVERQFYSKLFKDLVLVFSNEISLTCYSIWLEIGIKGFGHYDAIIRQACIEGFRSLVPLAPVGLHYLERMERATSSVGSSTKVRPSLPLIQLLLCRSTPLKITESANSLDKLIIQLLSSPAVCRNQSFKLLRDYQWEGISWWTTLRRCGLSGILTDEMYVY